MVKTNELRMKISQMLGYCFHNADLLLQATTHKSYTNEANEEEKNNHNERLEFLGDAVLNLVVSEMLMDAYPDVNEGELSRMRAALVNERELSKTADRLCLGELLRLGKGEEKDGGRTKHSLLADLFEALLAAVYLEGDLKAVREVVELVLGDMIAASKDRVPGFDPKSRLQVLLQQQGLPTPTYCLVEQTGPEHRRQFTAAVILDTKELGRGKGKNKKAAEQAAAKNALHEIENKSDRK